MDQGTLDRPKSFELEDAIQKAIKKVDGTKENDICKYLPAKEGGYLHHFTLRKMKNEAPEELISMIQTYIHKADRPSRVAPKPRAARGSRKRRDQVALTRPMLERMLNVARLVGDKEMIAMLSPKRPLAAIRRELLKSVRDGRADQELWDAWKDACSMKQFEETSK